MILRLVIKLPPRFKVEETYFIDGGLCFEVNVPFIYLESPPEGDFNLREASFMRYNSQLGAWEPPVDFLVQITKELENHFRVVFYLPDPPGIFWVRLGISEKGGVPSDSPVYDSFWRNSGWEFFVNSLEKGIQNVQEGRPDFPRR